MTRLGPGLHLGVPHDVYHADPCEAPSISPSLAKILLGQSPLHLKLAHPRMLGVFKPGTRAMNRGTFVHDELLGGDVGIVEVKAENYRTKVAQQARDAATEAGKVPMLSHEIAEFRVAADAIRPQIAEYLKGAKEVTAIWQRDGVTCRCRMDMLPDHTIIADLKTCEDAADKATWRTVLNEGMHIQAAANIEAVDALCDDVLDRPRFVLLCAEVVAPYSVIPMELDARFLELGRRRWDSAVQTFAQCMASGEWPGYDAGARIVKCPDWAFMEAA